MKTEAGSKVYLDCDQYGENEGLTKREYFAAAALQGFLAGRSEWEFSQDAARYAVETADALIFKLNKKVDNEQT